MIDKKANSIGEIVVHSPYPFSSYLGDIEIPYVSYDDRKYFRTGDLGWKDKDNFLYFHGRMDDRINVGGISVYLRDISEQVKKLEYVEDSILIGITDNYFGNVPALGL